MEVVIIEDEIPAASRLARMLQAAADDLHGPINSTVWNRPSVFSVGLAG